MAVDPQQAVERIARYFTNGVVGRPYPLHDIPVVPVLTRHTPLMAVVWNQVDADIMDNVLNIPGGTTRVVYSLTAIGQYRRSVSRMSTWLATILPYAQGFTFSAVEENEALYDTVFDQSDENSIFLTDYNDSPIVPPVPQYHTVPERQEQIIYDEPHIALLEPIHRVIVYNTICEGTQLDYDQQLDVWQGQAMFISHIGTTGG